MITPLDIQNKEFKRSLIRGYNTESVDGFLDEIIADYEKTYKENIELKDKINRLSDQIRQYKTLETTLKDTLIIAQSTADEVNSSARKKAENIVKNAELDGEKLIEKARQDVQNIKKQYEYLKREMFSFKTSYQSFIEAQLISLDKFYTEVDDEIIENKDKNESDKTEQ